jgi:A/G-specific adenine glycosylase
LEDKADHVKEFGDKLLKWYQKEARALPWRSNPDPYKIWISEIMLQQTKVETVIAYFERFLRRVPTIQALSEIGEDDLLKLWQGLGYYNRAINLKKAAQIIVQRFKGQMPSHIKDLQSLPGIGPYSSGAIASIAFGTRAPAIDGNVLRVIARITANKEDIGRQRTKKEIERSVKALLPLEDVGDFNQALMELGAIICLPKEVPKCNKCPVCAFCQAFQKGITLNIPVKVNKKQRKIERKTVFVISWDKRLALKKRANGGLLANLWELPNAEGHLSKEQSKKEINNLGISIKKIIKMKPSRHLFTHLEWQMSAYFVLALEVKDPLIFKWATKEEIDSYYSIPSAFKSFVKLKP